MSLYTSTVPAEASDRQLAVPGWLLSTGSTNACLMFTAMPSSCPSRPLFPHGEGLLSCPFGLAPGSLSEELASLWLSAEGRIGKKAQLYPAEDTSHQ